MAGIKTDFYTAAEAGTARAAPVLDPTAQKFADMLAASAGPPIYNMTPEAARGVLDGLQSGPIAQLPADIGTLTLPVGPTGKTEVNVVRPQGATGRLPVVVYFHGGGWILGNFKTHERLIRAIGDRRLGQDLPGLLEATGHRLRRAEQDKKAGISFDSRLVLTDEAEDTERLRRKSVP